jgi:hypothetical protein
VKENNGVVVVVVVVVALFFGHIKGDPLMNVRPLREQHMQMKLA